MCGANKKWGPPARLQPPKQTACTEASAAVASASASPSTGLHRRTGMAATPCFASLRRRSFDEVVVEAPMSAERAPAERGGSTHATCRDCETCIVGERHGADLHRLCVRAYRSGDGQVMAAFDGIWATFFGASVRSIVGVVHGMPEVRKHLFWLEKAGSQRGFWRSRTFLAPMRSATLRVMRACDHEWKASTACICEHVIWPAALARVICASTTCSA